MIDTRLPRFKIASNVLSALSLDVVNKTAADMQKMGLFKPPFPEFYIQAKCRLMEQLILTSIDKSFEETSTIKEEILFHYEFSTNGAKATPYLAIDGMNFCPLDRRKMEASKDVQYQFSWMADTTVRLLVVLLATKNIEKDVETCNKPNSRNRREQTLSKYSSTTTIKIGAISKTMRSEGGTGGPVRPHLRRGHIRNQPYGPGRLEAKRIFIQPMFVNADQGWIDAQKEYRVTA
jgi:hypothetical protein